MKYIPMVTGWPQGSGERGEDAEGTGGSTCPTVSILAPPPYAVSHGGAGGLSNSSSTPQLRCFLFILSLLCPELPFTLSNSLAITFLSRQAEI